MAKGKGVADDTPQPNREREAPELVVVEPWATKLAEMEGKLDLFQARMENLLMGLQNQVLQRETVRSMEEDNLRTMANRHINRYNQLEQERNTRRVGRGNTPRPSAGIPTSRARFHLGETSQPRTNIGVRRTLDEEESEYDGQTTMNEANTQGQAHFSLGKPKIDFPIFSGPNILHWIYKIEQYYTCQEVPRDSWIRYATMHFEDEAMEWYTWALKHNIHFPNWEEFLDELMKRF
ncbi:hypothetical protein QML37_29205, partial [Klebsiella pneumoniae]|uniref:hypothetical protein n=1 Tax=Klebsiella pneumoniae TaxID=573 RepID=UPI003A8112A4